MKNQMKIMDLKITVTEKKLSLVGLKSRYELPEERMNTS